MLAHRGFREDWTPERIRRQAARIGPNVEAFVEVIMLQRRHLSSARRLQSNLPRRAEQGYRSCLGVIRLAKTFGRDRLDAASSCALEINAHS